MSVQSSATSLLTDPHPCRHIVYPYNDEEKAINAVCLFASSGLSKAESVVLIMADNRCERITTRLEMAGFNLRAWRGSGKLVCISADGMLNTFMACGRLDERLVADTLADVIIRAQASSASGRVRI